MMSTTAGFQWGGTKINEKSSRNELNKFKFSSKKRKYQDDYVSTKKPENIDKLGKDYINNKLNKRAKIPIIKGERLPMNRMIESLNHDAVSKLLQDLVKIHPEISSTIYDLHPKVSVEDSIKLISNKFQLIRDNLPYKGDLENDYSYLRVKPFLNEFLNCLSDLILNYLPPVENNLLNSIAFLNVSTNLIIELPNFNNKEFKYIKLKCFEQISNTWLIILNSIYNYGEFNQKNYNINQDNNDHDGDNENEENLYNFVKIINDLDLKTKVESFNELSDHKFDKILEFINSKFEKVNSNLNEFITIDYSNYSLNPLRANSSN